MRFRKYLLVPWAAISFYALASMLSGVGGIKAYEVLLKERDEALENLETLKNLNQELEGSMNGLRYDSESIKIRARELGYGEEDERFVRIVGLPGVRYQEINPGAVKTAVKPGYIHDTTLRIISVLVGAAVFFLFFIKDMLFGAYGEDRSNGIKNRRERPINRPSGFSATRRNQSYHDSLL